MINPQMIDAIKQHAEKWHGGKRWDVLIGGRRYVVMVRTLGTEEWVFMNKPALLWSLAEKAGRDMEGELEDLLAQSLESTT